jgi:hypothetical protein
LKKEHLAGRQLGANVFLDVGCLWNKDVTCRSVQTELVITLSPFEHGLMELLVIVFAIAGVILGLLMILQSIYTLFKKPQ